MNFDKYKTIIQEFIIKHNFIIILISFFFLSSVSLNFQYFYYIIYNFNILMNKFISIQTERHFRQFRQIKIVKFYYYFMKNSFNIYQLQNNIVKTVSDLIIKLNQNFFKLKNTDNNEKFNLNY